MAEALEAAGRHRDPMKRVTTTLRVLKAVMIRSNGHEVWELPNGQKFIRSSTPSDCRASGHRQFKKLKRLLRIQDDSSPEEVMQAVLSA